MPKGIKCEIIPGEPYDRLFKKYVVGAARKKAFQRNNDFFVLCVGMTGTGKSSLGLHAYEAYDPEGCSLDYVALSLDEFKDSVRLVKDKELPKFLDYDEANVLSREAMTKTNRQLIKWYYRNRGMNIFHWWNNPSPRIDKELVDVRVNMVIYIYTTGSPRKYYALPRKRIQQMLLDNKTDTLTFRLLQENAKKYAAWQGWFRSYGGRLWPGYVAKKDSAMVTATDEFIDDKPLDESAVAKALEVSRPTLRRRVPKWIDQGLIIQGRDFVINTLGLRKYTRDGVSRLQECFMEERARGL